MKRRRSSKAKNQTYHFKVRCEQRLGVQIDRKSIQHRIKKQNFDENFYLLGRQSNRVTRYRFKFQDKWYIIPYDKNTHKVITIFEDKKQDIIKEKIETEIAPQVSTGKSLTCFEKFIQTIKRLVNYK